MSGKSIMTNFIMSRRITPRKQKPSNWKKSDLNRKMLSPTKIRTTRKPTRTLRNNTRTTLKIFGRSTTDILKKCVLWTPRKSRMHQIMQIKWKKNMVRNLKNMRTPLPHILKWYQTRWLLSKKGMIKSKHWRKKGMTNSRNSPEIIIVQSRLSRKMPTSRDSRSRMTS